LFYFFYRHRLYRRPALKEFLRTGRLNLANLENGHEAG
jgi:hypothetical protein